MRRWSLALLGLGACRSHASTVDAVVTSAAAPSATAVSPAASPPPHERPAPVATDWCIEGLSGLDEDVCYVLPPLAAGRPRRLLVYLHGIVPPLPDSPQKRTVETVVLHASERAGAAALVPRGRRGIGPVQARDWWAWPTTPGAIAELGPAIVARWAAAKKKLEAVAGAPFERTYLAGSSNGAYFLAALAVRGELPSEAFPVDGFGAMSGGAAGGAAAARSAPRPFYIGFGAYDEESKAHARSLAAALAAAHWPVRVGELPIGHGANEGYLDEAFAFWDSH